MVRFVMICGTASHVGKSIITAALCRLLVDRGFKVAPFKAQNMSLNSWVTKDGEEIGIAQAVQAWAAKTEPSADMNPVLLKPKGDMTSQVIVHGKPIGDKQVGEYYDSVDVIFEDICHSLKALAESYEVIVIEGAGSPAEINLWERDIANFRIARSVDAPVILVGDIERGGVFASLYGTIKLLPVDDRRRIRGIIINKFRGEEKLLEPGLKQLERLTSIPVLGVIPFMKVRLPSEDSVSLGDKLPSSHHELEIAVIRLPHISNFTDFEPLEAVARIRYVALESDLGSPDVVIIPGTKNTIDDLTAMRHSGMDMQIIGKAGTIPIIGICGGFQMLGESLIDEGLEGVQNEHKAFDGLKLLHVKTVFNSREKQTKQVEKSVTGNGPLLDSLRGQTIRGYEIHMGTTASNSPIFGDDGAQDDAGLILGTYLHGLFHNDNFRTALLSYVRSEHQPEQQEVHKSSSLVFTSPNSSQPETETDPYDELAWAIREHLDVEALYSIMDL
ncbi:MAG TPA: cobyric acid synthase [Candidatus Acidoferrales bacterium]|nr:cobyric acid synthase [Candidatus Acidoferrales bacterium]